MLRLKGGLEVESKQVETLVESAEVRREQKLQKQRRRR